MEEILIQNKRLSKIYIGESHTNFQKYIHSENIIFITDNNVHGLYSDFFAQHQTIVIESGESKKNLHTIEFIYNELLRLKTDRSSFIIGLGGGVVCDICGFAASTFLRGVPFGFIPSTLLCQVDASIGGKNGVNFMNFKNIIGNIHHPDFIICNPFLLNSLSDKEYRNGFSEIIKHALISDSEMFAYIEINIEKLLHRDADTILKLIEKSVKIKKKFVEFDETDHGIRRTLNFGHTLAHAIELNSDISHGDAVAIGIHFAAHWSMQKSQLPHSSLERISSLLDKLLLPIQSNISKDIIIDSLRKDKKRENESVHFVFLNEIGKSNIQKVTYSELENALSCFV